MKCILQCFCSLDLCLSYSTVLIISEINGFDKENKCNSLTENKKGVQEENQTDSRTRNDKLGFIFFHFGKQKEISLRQTGKEKLVKVHHDTKPVLDV